LLTTATLVATRGPGADVQSRDQITRHTNVTETSEGSLQRAADNRASRSPPGGTRMPLLR